MTYAAVMAINAFSGVAAGVALGWLSDKINDRRWLVILCALVGAVGFWLVWAWQSPFAFITAYCLLLPFSNALFSQTFAYSSLSGSGGTRPSRTDPFVSEDDLYNCLGCLPSSCRLARSPKLQFLRFCLCLGNTHRFHSALWTPLDPALRQNWTSKQEGRSRYYYPAQSLYQQPLQDWYFGNHSRFRGFTAEHHGATSGDYAGPGRDAGASRYQCISSCCGGSALYGCLGLPSLANE